MQHKIAAHGRPWALASHRWATIEVCHAILVQRGARAPRGWSLSTHTSNATDAVKIVWQSLCSNSWGCPLARANTAGVLLHRAAFAIHVAAHDARTFVVGQVTSARRSGVDCCDKSSGSGAQAQTVFLAAPDVIFTTVKAVCIRLSRASGFLSCTISSQRCSVPPKETRFSGLYRNKPAA